MTDLGARLLQIQKLVVARGGRNVVREVSLDIPSGEITALLGPNGAGKSSMVLAIGGVLKPVAGKVLLDEHDYAGKRPGADPASRARDRPRGPQAASGADRRART